MTFVDVFFFGMELSNGCSWGREDATNGGLLEGAAVEATS
jgi:hypothetical protein